jgi:hypothetical protein
MPGGHLASTNRSSRTHNFTSNSPPTHAAAARRRVKHLRSLMHPTSWYDPSMLTEIDSTITQLFGTAWR